MKPVDTIKGYQTEEPSQGPVSRNGRESLQGDGERATAVLFCFSIDVWKSGKHDQIFMYNRRLKVRKTRPNIYIMAVLSVLTSEAFPPWCLARHPYLWPHPSLIPQRGPATKGPQEETSDRWWAAIRRRHCTAAESLRWCSVVPSFRWCLVSSDVGWYVRDKLRPMRN